MKKLVFYICAGLTCFLVSCNNSTDVAGEHSESTQAEKNRQANDVVMKAFSTGDVSGIDSVVADDFVGHSEQGNNGRDSLKSMITSMKTNYSDMKMETISEAANDDYVFSLVRMTGTNKIATPGMPIGPYDMKSLEVSRFKDGKAVEHWSYMEMQDAMKMMGGNAEGPKIDTVKVKK